MRPSLAFLLSTLVAATGIASSPLDATALLRRFESRYRAAHTLQASFFEQYLDNGKVVRSEAGTAYFRRPGKMRWEYQSPEANLYIIDGKWSWFYVPADHTATRIRSRGSSDLRTPFALLAGEMKVDRVCKTVAMESNAKPIDPRGILLRCHLRNPDNGTPAPDQNASSESSLALFELDPLSGELLRVVVSDPGGVQVEFRFAHWLFDPPLNDQLFRFDPPRGVAIVDGDIGAVRAGSSPSGVNSATPFR
jgi:outer membrane lipoprotein carrier protein